MNIGNQIKALRLRRGVTQEAVAQQFGITAQAVSKWERGTSVPDIGMLPGLSAYFGVSIDELFALSDDIRISRIQNMLWDLRFLNSADVEHERQFLLDLVRREPKNSDPQCMLAQIELHLAKEHNIHAEEYALDGLSREISDPLNRYLARAMGGKRVEPRFNRHNALIACYKKIVAENPEEMSAYAYLITQLIDDHRLTEAKYYCEQMALHGSGVDVEVQKIFVALACGETDKAEDMWKKMRDAESQNWEVWDWIGHFETYLERYDAAKESFRRAIDLLKEPRYVDSVDALAQVCEMDGDIDGAIAAKKLELAISEKEWGITTGESVECIHREIARLEKLRKQAAV